MSEVIRNIMRLLPLGVVIITTKWNSKFVGIVVNTFNSLSLDPPLVMFAVDKTKGRDIPFKESEGFVVNFVDDENIFENFVKKPANERFNNIKFFEGRNGIPILSNSYAYIEAKKYAIYDIGDHSIVIGQIIESKISSDNPNPIVYYNRNYWKICRPDK